MVSFYQEVRVMEKWEEINAVRRVQDFINEHINEPITLSQLANAAGCSQWHTAGMFKEYTCRTQFEYIRALRLSKTAPLLRDILIRISMTFSATSKYLVSINTAFNITLFVASEAIGCINIKPIIYLHLY